MAGQNAFAFNGTAFVPEDRNLTAGISVFSTPTTRVGVARAYTLTAGAPSSQMWVGFPPTPVITEIANDRTGTFPNLVNSVLVKWSSDESSLIGSFTVFAKIGTGPYAAVATVASNLRQYRYGAINANTQYDFYIRSNGTAGLNSTSTASGISLSSPGLVSVLSSSSTTSTATVSWTVTAGVYQRFDIYDNATYLGTVDATSTGTSFSYTRTGLSQGTAYNFRVYGINYNNHAGSFREANVTVQTMPVPTISWADTSATKYGDYRITWTGSAGVTYQPEYSPNDVNWYNWGTSKSGTGTHNSDQTFTPAYNDDHWMRLYVYDGEVAAYSNKVKVTPGRPLVTYQAWGWAGTEGEESDRIDSTYSVNTPSSLTAGTTHNETKILWGNENALLLQATTTVNVRVIDFRVKATLITSGVSLSSDSRRVAVNTNNNAGRSTLFDNGGNPTTINFGGGFGYENTNTDRAVRTLHTYGVRDNISYWDKNTNGRWEYNSVSGQGNFWPSGRVKWEAELRWHRQDWETYTSQTQVNSTYA